MPAFKTSVGAVAKNTKNCLAGECVAYLWPRCVIMAKKKRRSTIAGITVQTNDNMCLGSNNTLLLGRNWEIEQHALEAGRGDCLLGVRCAFRDDYDDVA